MKKVLAVILAILASIISIVVGIGLIIGIILLFGTYPLESLVAVIFTLLFIALVREVYEVWIDPIKRWLKI